MRENYINIKQFCKFCINYRINFRNLKINFSTIEIKIKYFRASETIRLMQLIMRDDQIRKLYKYIYLCIFEKIITIINKIEKIVAIIIIKSLKYLIKSNVIHMTKKNISRMIQRVLNMSNIKKNKIVAKKKRKKFEFNVRHHNIKIKIAKTKITRFNLNNCDYHAF